MRSGTRSGARALIAYGVLVLLAAGCSTARRSGDPLGEALRARRLMVPVEGVAPGDVPDTFNAGRDGGSRVHHASDIMAPHGTRVLSADDGRLFKLSENRKGGITIYALSDDERFIYYYAHLSGYRRGIYQGMPVRRGDVLGYVGSTGNANAAAPHLHFQCMQYTPGGQWWNGRPIDARPYFASAGRARE